MSEIPRKYMDRREQGDTVLRQCQLVELHLLHVLDAICKKHGIPYVLGYGTLIGAMRHDGFIPWDDDLDVCMMRKDYDRFLSIAKRELPDDVGLQTPQTMPKGVTPFAKLRDKYSFFGEISPYISSADPAGIYLDIFPYDTVPRMPRKMQDFLVKAIGSSWHRTRTFYAKGNCVFPLVVANALVGGGCQVMHVLAKALFVGLQKAFPGDRVVSCVENGSTMQHERRDVFPAVLKTFEDAEFPVPNNADAVLTTCFGNWREIPPPERRPRHAAVIDPFHSVDKDCALKFRAEAT